MKLRFTTATTTAVLVLVSLLLLLLTSCSGLSTLKTIVDVTEAAIPVLQSAGVSIPPSIPQYVGAVANCIASAPGTPNAAQLLAISECLTKQIAPTLPPGTARTVVNVIQAVIKAVGDYLAQNPPASAPGPHTAIKPRQLSAADIAMVNELKTRAAVVVQKAKTLAASQPRK